MNEQDNLRVVQEAYAAFGRGDIPAVLSTLANGVEWLTPGPIDTLPLAGRRRDSEEVAQFSATLAETLEMEQFEPQEFIAQGDKVVVLGHFRYLVKATGSAIESDWAHIFTLDNGRTVSFREYYDTAAAVKAFTAPQLTAATAT